MVFLSQRILVKVDKVCHQTVLVLEILKLVTVLNSANVADIVVIIAGELHW